MLRLVLLRTRPWNTVRSVRYGSKAFSISVARSAAGQPWPMQPATANVSDLQIAQLAAKPLHSLTLADLVRYAQKRCSEKMLTNPHRSGNPPLTADALFSSANFTLSLLPIRLAHRIQALRNLPYIVVSNPHIARIYGNYMHSLSTLLPYQERRITTLEEEVQFTAVMADLVQTHAHTIPALARGFLECRKYISPAEVTSFLDEHLRTRIGTRLIAEQHIALHLSSQPHSQDGIEASRSISPTHVGVIDTALRPAEIVSHCEIFVGEICELKYGVRPTVVINGQPDTQLAHVPTHLEYILTELLKNAFRATVERGKEREPIEVTIAASPTTNDPTSDKTNPPEGHPPHGVTDTHFPIVPSVTIRIRDRGGGISPSNLPNIWAYSFTTFGEDEALDVSNGNIDALNAISGAGGDSSSLAGLGYGLPLGRAYAEHFGGGIAVQSLWGWGTDVYLNLRGLDRDLLTTT